MVFSMKQDGNDKLINSRTLLNFFFISRLFSVFVFAPLGNYIATILVNGEKYGETQVKVE